MTDDFRNYINKSLKSLGWFDSLILRFALWYDYDMVRSIWINRTIKNLVDNKFGF